MVPVCSKVWATRQPGLLATAGSAWQASLPEVQNLPDKVMCRVVAVESQWPTRVSAARSWPSQLLVPAARALPQAAVPADMQPTCQAG